MTPALLLMLMLWEPLAACSPMELAEYDAMGFDAYECDADAAARYEDSRAQYLENMDTEADTDPGPLP